LFPFLQTEDSRQYVLTESPITVIIQVKRIEGEDQNMTITVEAIYENGVLKLNQTLPLREQERVQVTIQQCNSPLLDSYGMMGWKGDAETIERIALDPEFQPEEAT
jgi:predicted DNA-binding antitoxin AbrB/MazE fold protein